MSHRVKKLIYYVPIDKPTRAYKLILQGLRNSDAVLLTQNPDEADYIFYHYKAFDPNLTFDPNRLVFIDFADDPLLLFPVKCLAYFKRSWVVNLGPHRVPIVRPKNVYPISYAIMDEFIVADEQERYIDFGCYLRHDCGIRTKLLDLADTINVARRQIGPINESSRDVFDSDYLRMLKRTKIVLTANPDQWEGDSRTWEALANGALVFVDRTYTPHRFPLVNKEHIIEYNRFDLGSLREKIEYYLAHPEEAGVIAAQGYCYAMQQHRAQHRIDDMLAIISG